MDRVWDKIVLLKPNWKIISFDELLNNWHTSRYLTQCYYNLEEKYDCGGINNNDFSKILEIYRKEIQ